MSKYLDELQAITHAREELNEKIVALYERRGVPLGIPLPTRIGDEEAEALLVEATLLTAREQAFYEKYLGADDPHALD